MHRRQVLMAAIAAAAVSIAPLSFAGVAASERRAALGLAWKRAVDGGRPLLVLVIPTDPLRSEEQGRILGRWLSSRDDHVLAPLSNVEPVCATLAELDRLLPGAQAAKGAWAILVRVDHATPTWRSVVPDEPQRFEEAITRVLTSEGLVPRREIARLAADVRQRWSTRAPPGSTWTVRDPCPMCGMAVISPEDARFLDLSTRAERP